MTFSVIWQTGKKQPPPLPPTRVPPPPLRRRARAASYSGEISNQESIKAAPVYEVGQQVRLCNLKMAHYNGQLGEIIHIVDGIVNVRLLVYKPEQDEFEFSNRVLRVSHTKVCKVEAKVFRRQASKPHNPLKLPRPPRAAAPAAPTQCVLIGAVMSGILYKKGAVNRAWKTRCVTPTIHALHLFYDA